MSDSERDRALHPIVEFLQAEVPTRPGRTLVLAASAGAAAALRRQLTRLRGALLGVDFVTSAGLGQRLLMFAGRHPSESIPDPLEERELLRDLLPDNEVGRYARRFGSALEHLRETLRELDALGPVPPQEPVSRTGERVIDLGARFRATLRDRGGRARWIAAATAAVLEVAGEEVSWLPDCVLIAGPQPVERDCQLLLEILRGQGVPVLRSPDPQTAPGAPLPLSSSPHAFAELRHAARRCADAAALGMPWHEMVVAAPQIQAYAAHLPRAFRAEGVPVHTAVENPLIDHPRASLCLHAARLLFDDAPRPSFLALASAPLLATPIPPEEVGTLDRLSRKHGLSGTGPESEAFLRRLHFACSGETESPAPAVVQLLRATLDQAQAARLPDADDRDGRLGFRRRSRFLQRFLDEYLQPPQQSDPSGEAATERITHCLDAVVFAGSAHQNDDLNATFVGELAELLRSRTIPLAASRVGGVHAVSFAEALSFPCRHLQLIGLTEQAIPSAPPQTTFLGESDRLALRMQTGELLRTAEEQRLRQLLHHAPQVHLSYPRTDVRGRSVGVTCWLERLDRDVPIAEEAREPAHPESVARKAAASGRCPTDLTIDHLALAGCEDAAPFLQVLERPRVRKVLQRVQELEAFHRPTLDLDGDIGPQRGSARLQSSISVTGLATLGSCPQRFLFEQGFRIRPLEDEPDPLSLPRDRIGTLIHQVVENLYLEFLPALREAEDPQTLSAAMHERAASFLAKELARDTSALKRRFPGLHALLQQRWLDGLTTTIEADLEQMARDHSRPEGVESELRCTLPFRGPQDLHPVELRLHGKLDRIDTLRDGGTQKHRRVLDFKTGAKPEKSVSASGIFKGTKLQLVLYARMLQEAQGKLTTELEIRSIRPRSETDEDIPTLRYPLKDAPSYMVGDRATGVDETVAILGQLVDRGLLPPIDGHHCSYCRFKSACRRFHPPSAQRVQECDDKALHNFRRLSKKSSQKPILDAEDDA